MKSLLLYPIDLYRKHLSKQKASPCCRYFPSCSNYAYRAINEWGSIVGLFMAIFRILKCNPLFRGGLDPVPRRKRKLIPKTESFGRDAVTTDKTAEMFDPKQTFAFAKACSISPVNRKTQDYRPYLTRMERYLDNN